MSGLRQHGRETPEQLCTPVCYFLGGSGGRDINYEPRIMRGRQMPGSDVGVSVSSLSGARKWLGPKSRGVFSKIASFLCPFEPILIFMTLEISRFFLGILLPGYGRCTYPHSNLGCPRPPTSGGHSRLPGFRSPSSATTFHLLSPSAVTAPPDAQSQL